MWDADKIEVAVLVTHNGGVAPAIALHYAGEASMFDGAIELAAHVAQPTLVAHADHFFEDDPSRTACLAQVSEFFGAMRDGSNPKNGT